MPSIESIESDLTTALKARDQVTVETLRGLKTRIQNEQIAKGQPVADDDIIALIRSEVKRRNDAASAFDTGDRSEMAAKERQEAAILQNYLPAQIGEDVLEAKIDSMVAANSWTAKDFGVAMGQLKSEFGTTADGGTLSRILKNKLNS